MTQTRRGFLLTAGASLLVAPAIVRAASLEFVPRAAKLLGEPGCFIELDDRLSIVTHFTLEGRVLVRRRYLDEPALIDGETINCAWKVEVP